MNRNATGTREARLSQLVAQLTGDEALRVEPGADGTIDPKITGLCYDSRRAKPGDLFFCLPGLKSDGSVFLPNAVKGGAVAALAERSIPGSEVPVVVVPNARRCMAAVSAAFTGYPSRSLRLVGVTGTNGKTTTTFLIEAIARGVTPHTAVIGTIGWSVRGVVTEGERTTPESPDLQLGLAQFLADSCPGDPKPVVAMEVSSHGLIQERTAGLEYDVAVFTNLTQDHLDFHGTMDAYFDAKAILFEQYPTRSSKPFTAVINRDDHYGRQLCGRAQGTLITYGLQPGADLQAESIRATAQSLSFDVRYQGRVYPVAMKLGGLFNVSNTLGAIGACLALGMTWDQILSGLGSATGVPGRFESVHVGQDFGVVVDYAHTPDGLENVLKAARALEPSRLLVVFGCGGDRDRTKRPIMGRLAAELADRVIVTSDNPRSESPTGIVEEILAGVPGSHATRVTAEVDRRRAICQAVREAKPGDLVVIAGKGHETYQIFATETIHFDDREEARAQIQSRYSD